MFGELEKEKLINEKIIEENIKLKKLVEIQDKLIKSYDLKKHEYQRLIIKKSIKMNRCLQKTNKDKENDEEEEI